MFGSKALYSSNMDGLSAGDYGIGLAIAYLSIHIAMLLAARYRPERFLRLLAVDLILIGGLLAMRLLRHPAEVVLLVRLWTPIIFFGGLTNGRVQPCIYFMSRHSPWIRGSFVWRSATWVNPV